MPLYFLNLLTNKIHCKRQKEYHCHNFQYTLHLISTNLTFCTNTMTIVWHIIAHTCWISTFQKTIYPLMKKYQNSLSHTHTNLKGGGVRVIIKGFWRWVQGIRGWIQRFGSNMNNSGWVQRFWACYPQCGVVAREKTREERKVWNFKLKRKIKGDKILNFCF